MFGAKRSKEQRLELKVQVIKQKGNVKRGDWLMFWARARG